MSSYAIPETPCYLNGRFLRLCDAQVSVLDRGFLFGDGVYEAVPVYAGRVFRFEAHMARLQRSLQQLRIPNPLSATEWLGVCRRLVAEQASEVMMFYLQVTRGVAAREHAMPPGLAPTAFAMLYPLKMPTPAQRSAGVACVSSVDFRWQRADIKSISLLGNVMARQISADLAATETLLFRDGFLTEASASNVWVVKDGAVSGPLKSHQVLEGVRYELLRELCATEGIAYSLRPITTAEVREASELILSSSSKELLPVTRLDGLPVGSGRPGPVYERLYAAYCRAVEAQAE